MGISDVVFVGDNYEADFVGPSQAGLHGYLIDPDQAHDVPDHRRLNSVLGIEARLNPGSGQTPPTSP